MGRWVKVLVLGALVATLGACVSVEWTPEQYLMPKLLPLAVTVEHEAGGGSGVWVGEDLVLTAKHVLKGYDGFRKQITVTDTQGKVYIAKVAAYATENPSFINKDWIILRVEDVSRQTWARPDCGDRYVGEKVIGIGNGQLYTGLLPYLGRIQTVNFDPSSLPGMQSYWGDAILTNMDGAPGVSGGPVFDMDGELIGLMVGAFQDRGAGSFQQITYPVRHIEILCP